MPQEVKEYLERDPEHRISEGSERPPNIPEQLQIQPEVIEQNPIDPTRNSTVVILTEQAQSIVEEWRHDLANNSQNSRDLELYFAGKIDQHNIMITLADLAHPDLREALPQQLNFAEIKAALELEQIQRQQATVACPGMGF